MSESRRRRVCLVPVKLQVNRNRSRLWYERDLSHCSGGLPAMEYADGSREWYERGLHHRGGGLPAMEDADGSRAWWERGRFIRHEEVSS